ncbi:MAG: hypothetical protein ACO4BJ_11900 [Planctomycetota bacterium]
MSRDPARAGGALLAALMLLLLPACAPHEPPAGGSGAAGAGADELPEPGRETTLPPAGNDVVVPLPLPPAAGVPGAILGHVSTAEGPGHEFVVQAIPLRGGEHVSAVADPDGMYLLEELAPGRYLVSSSDLAAIKSGWIRQRSRAITIGAGEVLTEDFTFDDGVTLRGRVEVEGAWTRRTQVQLLRRGAPRLAGTLLSDTPRQIALATWSEGTTYLEQDGSFVLLDVRPGRYDLRIRTFPDASTDRSTPWEEPEYELEVEVGGESLTLPPIAG